MAGQDTLNPHIIGLTGSFGSGCTYIGKNILRDKEGYKYLSLSEHVLKPWFKEQTGKDPGDSPRRELQEFGDQSREQKGNGCFAEEIVEIIAKDQEENGDAKWVVDSIRNPEETRVLHRFSRNFFLFGIYSEKEVRWERSKVVYNDDRTEFEKNDRNDTGEENPPHGQRVADCFYGTDVVLRNDEPYAELNNEDFVKFAGRIAEYVNLVSHPLAKQKTIRPGEALMAIAYAIGQRSSCMRRKVGAVIVDPLGNIISSGTNEVPGNEKPCDKIYKCCYREWVCSRFIESLKAQIPAVDEQADKIKTLFRDEFKILDYCRALHAEENAIVNLARNGNSVPLDQCTLYSTTYPCRMCANKIVQAGIRNVVYVEPYPDDEAKTILEKGGVQADFFEGVTSNADFRLYGEEK